MGLREPGSSGAHRRWRALLVLALAPLVTSTAVRAVEFRAGETVVVPADEVIYDDLYVTGDSITIDGRVEGDVVAAGRLVRLNGSIRGDLTAVGQAVEVNGRVGDDVRMAGMALRFGGASTVVDDAFTAGFSTESAAGSSILGTLVVAGYQALLAGRIGEDLRTGAAAVEILGTIAGDVEAGVGPKGPPAPYLGFLPSPVPIRPIPSGLTLGDSARIGGRLAYTAPDEASVAPGAEIKGGVEFHREEEQAKRALDLGTRALRGLRRLLAVAVVGLALVALAPGFLRRAAAILRARPGASFGYGLVSVVAWPLGAGLLLLVSILLALLFGFLTLSKLVALALGVGLASESLLVFGFWVSAAFLAPIVVATGIGQSLWGRFRPHRAEALAAPLLVGLILLSLLWLLPGLGRLAAFCIFAWGLGALALLTKRPRSDVARDEARTEES